MALITVEISSQTWRTARAGFRRPWSEAAALLDLEISGLSGDPLQPRRLAARWGWGLRRVYLLLRNRPANDANNRR